MFRVLPSVLTIGVLLIAAPASAIPVCPSGTMADYIAFGSTGCNLKNLTFLNFSYSGSVNAFSPEDFFFGRPVSPPPSPSAISVVPLSDVARLGSGGAALRFTAPALTLGSYWTFVDIDFEVFARTGPGIVGNTLSAGLQTIPNLQSAAVTETIVPGGRLEIVAGPICVNIPSNPPPPSSCANPTGRSLPFTTSQGVAILGSNVLDFEAGFATPEPTTLLLVGTSAAGLGLVRWWKRRRSRGYEHESSSIP